MLGFFLLELYLAPPYSKKSFPIFISYSVVYFYFLDFDPPAGFFFLMVLFPQMEYPLAQHSSYPPVI